MNDADAAILLRVRKILAPLKLYTVEEVLGSGMMGSVVLVNHKVFGKRAIKLVSQGFSSSPTLRIRFENEAKIMNQLNNPHVVNVYDMGEVGEFPDDHPYIIMEYMPGGCLADHLDEFGAMPCRQAVHVTIAILKGLQAAHDQGIVHRDVKPQNILFDLNGNVKVADFGIARVGADLKRLTNDGNAIGTMSYMSFEQLDGAPDIDGRADQYAVGVTLFQMVANMDLEFEPFFSQVARKPHWWDPVPDVLKAIIKKATSIAPEQRFESANVMVQALEACLTQLPEDSIVTQALGSAPAHRKMLKKLPPDFDGTLSYDGEPVFGWDDPYIFPGDDQNLARELDSDSLPFAEEVWEYHPPNDSPHTENEFLQPIVEEMVEEVQVPQPVIETLSSVTRKHRLVWIVSIILVCTILITIASLWFGRRSEHESISAGSAVSKPNVPLTGEEAADTTVPIPNEIPVVIAPSVSQTTPIPSLVKKPKPTKTRESGHTAAESAAVQMVPEIPQPEVVLPESQVRVILKPDTTTAKVTLSGEKGTFVVTGGILNLPQGTYQVTVELPERSEPQTGSLVVGSGTTTITCDARFKMCKGLK
ncbi:protein kinase [Candidatus Uhrbacteria bacterium]|nr:protein kinase [Candidatus Uhrbacteria bacterium]